MPRARRLADDLAAAGVDVRVQRAGRTGTVVLLVDAEGERTMFPDRGASAELADVDPAWLDGVAWLHLPAYGLEREPMRAELARLATALGSAARRVSMDASSTGLLAGLGVEYALDLIRAIAPDVLLRERGRGVAARARGRRRGRGIRGADRSS